MIGKELVAEVKRRYPIGCKFRIKGSFDWNILEKDHITYNLAGDNIVHAHNGYGSLVKNGVWAETENNEPNYEIY